MVEGVRTNRTLKWDLHVVNVRCVDKTCCAQSVVAIHSNFHDDLKPILDGRKEPRIQVDVQK